LYDLAVAFSLDALTRLLHRHPQKLRLRRQILAVPRRGRPSRFPEASSHALRDLCLEVESLEHGLAGFLERCVPSGGARRILRRRWRRVQEANAVQLAFLDAWDRGGVVETARMQEVARAIARECRELRLFARDLAPRVRPRLVVVHLGEPEPTAPRALAGAAIPVRIDPESRAAVALAYHHIACFDTWRDALAYRGLYRSYTRALTEDCGLALPWGAERIVRRPEGGFHVYIAARRIPAGELAAEVCRALPHDACVALARALFEELARVWQRSPTPGDGGVHVAVLGRLDHWAIEGVDPELPEIRGDERLVYLGAYLPLLRRRGRALLDPRIQTERIPWPVRAAVDPLVRSALLRHHELRHVLVDAIASFGSPVQPKLVDVANELIDKELGHFVDRTIELEDVREHRRQRAHLCRLLGSLDHVGSFLDGWRRGRDPGLLDAAVDLYGILVRSRA
jgi:hypothetical protein